MDLPFLTADVPGTGGTIRERVEDFVVEEIPLYEASGVGEHLYLTIQKVGISTHEAVLQVARGLGVPPGFVGYAGLKDARALTRQTLSVQGVPESRVRALEIPGLQVLDVRRHRNKLRMGHLAGNRFVLRIRGVSPDAAEPAGRVLQRLETDGVPNLFGPQRFGSKGDSWRVGRALVRREPEVAVEALLAGDPEREKDDRLREARRRFGEGDLAGARAVFPPSFQAERRVLEALVRGDGPKRALRRIPKTVFRFLVTSYQSHLFNRLLGERMPDLGALQEGDLAYLHDRGAVFVVEDPAAEQPRADAMEISPSAPLCGHKTLFAGGEPGRRERALLADEGIELEDFRLPGARLEGGRRPLRAPIGSPGARPDGEDAILVSFDLPRGSYATAVLREVMKEDDPGLADGGT